MRKCLTPSVSVAWGATSLVPDLVTQAGRTWRQCSVMTQKQKQLAFSRKWLCFHSLCACVSDCNHHKHHINKNWSSYIHSSMKQMTSFELHSTCFLDSTALAINACVTSSHCDRWRINQVVAWQVTSRRTNAARPRFRLLLLSEGRHRSSIGSAIGWRTGNGHKSWELRLCDASITMCVTHQKAVKSVASHQDHSPSHNNTQHQLPRLLALLLLLLKSQTPPVVLLGSTAGTWRVFTFPRNVNQSEERSNSTLRRTPTNPPASFLPLRNYR